MEGDGGIAGCFQWVDGAVGGDGRGCCGERGKHVWVTKHGGGLKKSRQLVFKNDSSSYRGQPVVQVIQNHAGKL